MGKKFDPVTLEILWRRMISIVDEADGAVSRTAFSSLVRDAHDYTCMFTDSSGRELAQGTFATPGQSGAMAIGIQNLIKTIPLDLYHPGDVFITNDPWALAGHLNDVCVLSPMYYLNTLIGFTACVLHHSDIGGRVSTDNHDVFEDGLFIPLVKIYERGTCNDSLMKMIQWNVRTPDNVIGDIRSQIAANHVCSEKIIQMLCEYKLDSLDELADEIIERTEKSMRLAIKKIPDGVYPGTSIIEQMEGEPDITIRLAVHIEGSTITVDFDGTSPQVNWGGNVVYNFTYAYVHMAIKSMFDPDIPNNEGCARPIRVKAPEGSIVNCTFPSPVHARMLIGHFVTETIYRAVVGILPDRVIAACGGTPATMNVFYGKRHNGTPWHSVVIRGGGMGAGQNNDGECTYIFPANGANTPIEIMESDTPLIIESREFLTDSGGAGTFRGGLGRREVFRIPNDEYAPLAPVNLGIQSGRFRYPPLGLYKGQPGAKARFLINGKPGNSYKLNQCYPGDIIIMDTAGGGGFGDPLDRDLDLVENDVLNGCISIECAKNEYGAVIDTHTMKVKRKESQKLRLSLKNTNPGV